MMFFVAVIGFVGLIASVAADSAGPKHSQYFRKGGDVDLRVENFDHHTVYSMLKGEQNTLTLAIWLNSEFGLFSPRRRHRSQCTTR